MTKKKILFLCTHNSARSQLAEGLLRHYYGDCYEAYSAGTQPSKVNPYIVAAMQELGIDISGHHSKHVDEFHGVQFAAVVTVCDNAKESCPFFPGAGPIIHHSFPDPSAFSGTHEEIMTQVRTVRDAIKTWLDTQFMPKEDGSL